MTLSRRPTLAVVDFVTLGLCIGARTAMFSIIDELTCTTTAASS